MEVTYGLTTFLEHFSRKAEPRRLSLWREQPSCPRERYLYSGTGVL
jgi:hypothetical protein